GGGMLLCGLITTVIVLVMPVTYTASTVILTSESGSGGAAAALLGQLGGSLGALASLGGGGLFGSQSDTFVGVLNSRTVADEMIEKFHLQKVYRKRTLVDTRKSLGKHTHIEGTKGSFIRISVDDHNARRAADMANTYVDQLYRRNQTLALTTASQRRLFLESQVKGEKDQLANAEGALRELQQKTGVIQLAGQAEITLRSIAQLRAEISAKEVLLETLRTTETEQNGDVQRLESGLNALREQLKKAESDSNASQDNYFVSAGRIPQAGLEYLRRVRDVRYHEALFETLSKQYELARIDEAKAPAVIQVVDKAIVLDRRSWPPRTLLVLLALFTSGALLSGWVLLRNKWSKLAEVPENALHISALRKVLRQKNRLA
ncbi:MAG TPA: GNVR domain-containing protein, partial [Ktedonobacteraceae bacterium]|nr:GNVR domain-containing protein [Ktedonobacteraceae bacterium]